MQLGFEAEKNACKYHLEILSCSLTIGCHVHSIKSVSLGGLVEDSESYLVENAASHGFRDLKSNFCWCAICEKQSHFFVCAFFIFSQTIVHTWPPLMRFEHPP